MTDILDVTLQRCANPDGDGRSRVLASCSPGRSPGPTFPSTGVLNADSLVISVHPDCHSPHPKFVAPLKSIYKAQVKRRALVLAISVAVLTAGCGSSGQSLPAAAPPPPQV